MAITTVEAMVEGGKASAAPPLGPALGPTGVNIGQLIADINKKTTAFAGMQVPVKVKIDTLTKEYNIEIGTPPTSNLIMAEAKIEKGSGIPNKDKVADLMIEQVIKIAKMKEDTLSGKTLKEKVKSIVGTCVSMGILIEGKDPKIVLKEIDDGIYDAEIKAEKTELTEEEKKALEEEKKRLAEEVTKRRAEEEKKANEIITAMAKKEKTAIRAKLREAGISEGMITKLLAGVAVAGKPTAAATTSAPTSTGTEKKK